MNAERRDTIHPECLFYRARSFHAEPGAVLYFFKSCIYIISGIGFEESEIFYVVTPDDVVVFHIVVDIILDGVPIGILLGETKATGKQKETNE